MMDKELRRLGRHELLQLLLAQGRETEKAKRLQADTEMMRQQTILDFDRLKLKLDDKDAQIERLKTKLDDKDAQMEHLKKRLDDKDAQIERLKQRLNDKDVQLQVQQEEMDTLRADRDIILTESGSIAEAALRLSGIFEAAQKAADEYLYNLRRQEGGTVEEE